jgi:hypothetical protein
MTTFDSPGARRSRLVAVASAVPMAVPSSNKSISRLFIEVSRTW